MSIGERIKKHRLKNNLTQKELSVQLGLTSKMISFYENDERTPPADILIKLSRIFTVSTDYLLGLSEKKKDSVISDFEVELLNSFRALSKDEQEEVIEILRLKLRRLKKDMNVKSSDSANIETDYLIG